MSKAVVGLVMVACAASLSAFGQSKVVFDNQSGTPALVTLIGPTKTEVEVPNGAKAGVDAAAGRYTIKIRYGTPDNYRYTKGEEFEVTGTGRTRPETTITLHKVVAGNYETHPISETDFDAERVRGNTTGDSQRATLGSSRSTSDSKDQNSESLRKRIVGRWQTTGGQMGPGGVEIVIEFNDQGKVPEWGVLENGGRDLFCLPAATEGNMFYAIDMSTAPPSLRVKWSDDYFKEHLAGGRDAQTVHEWSIESVDSERMEVTYAGEDGSPKPLTLVREKKNWQSKAPQVVAEGDAKGPQIPNGAAATPGTDRSNGDGTAHGEWPPPYVGKTVPEELLKWIAAKGTVGLNASSDHSTFTFSRPGSSVRVELATLKSPVPVKDVTDRFGRPDRIVDDVLVAASFQGVARGAALKAHAYDYGALRLLVKDGFVRELVCDLASPSKWP